MQNVVPSIAAEPDIKDTLRNILDESGETLQPISPGMAVDMYLDDRKRDCAAETVKGHRSRLGFFVDWCREEGIDNLNDGLSFMQFSFNLDNTANFTYRVVRSYR